VPPAPQSELAGETRPVISSHDASGHSSCHIDATDESLEDIIELETKENLNEIPNPSIDVDVPSKKAAVIPFGRIPYIYPYPIRSDPIGALFSTSFDA
jgi:hypothetical protein